MRIALTHEDGNQVRIELDAENVFEALSMARLLVQAIEIKAREEVSRGLVIPSPKIIGKGN